jgi:hypothetical protein
MSLHTGIMTGSVHQLLEPLVGSVCTQSRSGFGSFISMDFVRGSQAETTENWGLFVNFGEWELRQGSSVLCNWETQHSLLAEAIEQTTDTMVTALDVTEDGGLLVAFEHELVLSVRPGTYDSSEPWWLVCRGEQEVLSVGPGPTFDLDPSGRQ